MRSVYDRLRNTTYTGERRCWPCTAVNAAILLLASVGVARRRSVRAGLSLAVGGAAVIALRGYLVPYTPRFAPRLVSWLPGDPFHARKANAADAPDAPDASGSLGGGADEEAGERVVAALAESGVLVTEDETLYLDEAFRDRWRTEIHELRNRDDAGLADALRAAAPDRAVADMVEPRGDRWFVVSDGSDDPANESWLTRPVAIAEIAAVRALADRTSIDAAVRAQAAAPLRTFLQSCPSCDGLVEETTTVNCCGGTTGTRDNPVDEVLACADCGERLYTFQ